MTFEDELRATMRAHDHEAPTGPAFVASAVPAARARPRRLLPALLAAAVVVAGAVALAAVRSDDTTRPVAAPACPTEPAGTHGKRWTPPSTASSADRLVPTAVPDAGVVCRYTPDGVATRRVLTDLDRIPGALAYTPRVGRQDALRPSLLPACAVRGMTDYQIGLRYAGKVVWVSADYSQCADGTAVTDRFTGRTAVGADATAAFETRRWPAATPKQPYGRLNDCAPTSNGRLDDDRTLIPTGVTRLEICGVRDPSTSGATRTTTLTGRAATDLVAELDAPTATTEVVGCEVARTTSTSRIQLTAYYASGPAVTLNYLASCRPNVATYELTAQLPAGLGARIVGYVR